MHFKPLPGNFVIELIYYIVLEGEISTEPTCSLSVWYQDYRIGRRSVNSSSVGSMLILLSKVFLDHSNTFFIPSTYQISLGVCFISPTLAACRIPRPQGRLVIR